MRQLNQRHLVALCAWIVATSCHTVITYPGWRGDNLFINGTVEDTNGVGVGVSGDSMIFPYGMQWIYPCGGLPITENRTNWPVTGGAVAFQPGWFVGHKAALMYINIGFGSVPQNYSIPLVPRFEIEGPTNNPYPGTVCLPQVPIPDGFEAEVGGHATIQVVQAAVHGAALYSCVDITFADLADVEQPDATNCFNSTNIQFLSNDGTASPTASSSKDTWGWATASINRPPFFGTPTTTTSSAGSSETPNAAGGNKVGRALEASFFMGLFGALH